MRWALRTSSFPSKTRAPKNTAAPSTTDRSCRSAVTVSPYRAQRPGKSRLPTYQGVPNQTPRLIAASPARAPRVQRTQRNRRSRRSPPDAGEPLTLAFDRVGTCPYLAAGMPADGLPALGFAGAPSGAAVAGFASVRAPAASGDWRTAAAWASRPLAKRAGSRGWTTRASSMPLPFTEPLPLVRDGSRGSKPKC